MFLTMQKTDISFYKIYKKKVLITQKNSFKTKLKASFN